MKEIIVLAEHRRGELRDMTWEMLSKGRQLSESMGAEMGVALLGKGVSQIAEALKPRAHRVLLIEDDRLENYNSETYEKVLTQLITERKPFLTLIGHTAMGMDFAPGLAAHLKMPLATDCIGIEAAGEDLFTDSPALWRKSQCHGLLFEERALHGHPSFWGLSCQ